MILTDFAEGMRFKIPDIIYQYHDFLISELSDKYLTVTGINYKDDVLHYEINTNFGTVHSGLFKDDYEKLEHYTGEL